MKTQTLLTAGMIGALLLGFGSGCRPKQQQEASGPSAAVIESMNRGVSLMGQYDYDGATKAFEEASAAAPGLSDITINLALSRFNRGRKESQDIEQAQALLESVLQKEPDNIRAGYVKGIVLLHAGQPEPAMACFEKVVQARPDDGVAWYLLGMCKQHAGQKAERELLKAVELRPYLTSAYYKLWQSYQAEDRTSQAQPFLEKFMQLRDSPLNEIIEVPQYNQMGELALALPIGAKPAPTVAKAAYRAGAPIRISSLDSASLPAANPAPVSPLPLGGAAFAGSDSEGRPQFFLVACPGIQSRTLFGLTGRNGGVPVPTSTNFGLGALEQPLSCAVGDYDNDEVPDLFVVGSGSNHLFHGAADGTFTEVTQALKIASNGGSTRSALWLDADHDGDLDLFLCNAGAPNQLFNNNADGTFTEVAAAAGVAVPEGDSVMVLSGDLDGDRDMDLVILRSGAPAKVFLNDLGSKFHEVPLDGLNIRGDLGGALQDFNGDGILDLLVLGGEPAELNLFLGDGHGYFKRSATFAEGAKAAAAAVPLRGFRVADLDLDGDLDIALFGREGHILWNEGTERFTFQPSVWKTSPDNGLAGAELADLTGDLVPDLLLLERGKTGRVTLIPGELTSPSTALSLAPTGVQSRDKRTRSPASGYGVTATVRAGLREQSRSYTGQSGGFNQSPLPLVFGLGGAKRADYVRFIWSDGVAQVETALPAGQHRKVAENQRKIASCPVLFTWNGARFEVITDFAGVGGLGYLAAPGEYAYPQPLDYVKIEPQQLRPREGAYELRVTEPMEETAYVDRLELMVIDHPSDWQVYPDERLAVSGPPPTHELLAVDRPIFARRALNPEGQDCTERLLRVDRLYAYEPVLDRRFYGFCHPHTLDLDFGDQLAGQPSGRRVFLFINGYLEYPYSQTTYAASQAQVTWDPIRIERQQPDGQWKTIVPDAGAFGGMARTMTVDLTGLVDGASCRLRLSTNLEISYDQIFLGVPASLDRVQIHHLPVADADLRYAGFPREISPDGRMPLVYDYVQRDATVPFRTLTGAYTRYGPVRELLEEFDDRYVLIGSGDELAVKFDATKLPALPAGTTRSFVLISHAYCKDMDLYTGTPQTLEPMPFRGMSRYPYPPMESYPDTKENRESHARYNTRIVK